MSWYSIGARETFELVGTFLCQHCIPAVFLFCDPLQAEQEVQICVALLLLQFDFSVVGSSPAAALDLQQVDWMTPGYPYVPVKLEFSRK